MIVLSIKMCLPFSILNDSTIIEISWTFLLCTKSRFRYLTGFMFWNVDNIYCDNLTRLRERTLNPAQNLRLLSPFTQLHGWWHLFAGYGTYVHILACVQYRLRILRIDSTIGSSFVGIVVKISPVQKLKMLKSKYYEE